MLFGPVSSDRWVDGAVSAGTRGKLIITIGAGPIACCAKPGSALVFEALLASAAGYENYCRADSVPQLNLRNRGSRSRSKSSRKRRWSWPGAWNTRWLSPYLT